MLPHRKLQEGSRDPTGLAALITAAERALRTWEPVWTPFLDAPLREEAEQRLGVLAELDLRAEGGYPGAERCRLLLWRREAGLDPDAVPTGLGGLEISGNFLFDPCQPAGVRAALGSLGLAPGDLGDVWVRGDRGAQAIALAAAAAPLAGAQSQIGGVEVQLDALPLERLQPPLHRQPRRFHTVEASTRLDAVASAGFGLSRNRMAELIRGGAVRVNWDPVSSASRELALGDRIQLSGRGELVVEAIAATKRERWRLTLMRH